MAFYTILKAFYTILPLNPLAGVETNVYCFTGLLVRYLCGCCLAVFVLMTSTLSLALHPTFYDQCTIVGTNPRATAVKTNPQANSHRSLLAHSLLRHAQDNMPHDTPSAIVLVTVTLHRLHLQNIGHARFVYVCNERHIANTYLHCARHSSICRQCCFSGCEKLGGRTGFALLP